MPTDTGPLLVPEQGAVPGAFDPSAPGLRVRMRPIRGLTKKGLFDSYGTGGFLFQVPPMDEFSREYGFDYNDYQTINRETYTRAIAPTLTTITFPTMLVDDDYDWTLVRLRDGSGVTPDPITLSHDLIAICRSGTPFRLTAGQPALWGSKAEVSMQATLRNLTVAERAGEIDARYLNVTFVQFNSNDPLTSEKLGKAASSRKYPARVTLKANGGASLEPPHAHPHWGNSTKAGPVTLRKLAKFYYGSNARWPLIAKKNALKNCPPGDALYPIWKKRHRHGPVLIPAPPEA